jgi:peptide/nickel transport system permease protein
VQYARFAQGLVPLPETFLDRDVYYSYNNAVPVREEIARRAPVSVALAVGALVLWLVISIPLGVFAALHPRSGADRVAMASALVFISIPTFTVGYLLLYVFWFKLAVAPSSGLPPEESLWQSIFAGRFILPWISLALVFIALYTRMTRSHFLEALASDPIRAARAKGLSERHVLSRHAFRLATVPLLTMVAIDFAALLGGTIVIETVFNLPGLGQYTVQAVRDNDLPAVMGITVFAAIWTLLANLVVDVLYVFLDPRIRYR